MPVRKCYICKSIMQLAMPQICHACMNAKDANRIKSENADRNFDYWGDEWIG